MPRVKMLSIMACPTICADIGDIVDVPIEMARDLVKGEFAEEVDSLEPKPAVKTKAPLAASRASGQSDTPPAKDGESSKEGAEEPSKKAKA